MSHDLHTTYRKRNYSLEEFPWNQYSLCLAFVWFNRLVLLEGMYSLRRGDSWPAKPRAAVCHCTILNHRHTLSWSCYLRPVRARMTRCWPERVASSKQVSTSFPSRILINSPNSYQSIDDTARFPHARQFCLCLILKWSRSIVPKTQRSGET